MYKFNSELLINQSFYLIILFLISLSTFILILTANYLELISRCSIIYYIKIKSFLSEITTITLTMVQWFINNNTLHGVLFWNLIFYKINEY